MKQKLHVLTRMFLKDPYIVRITHTGCQMPNLDLAEFRKLLKTAKSMITETWGYSNPDYFIVRTTEVNLISINGVGSFPTTVPEYECYSYWAFTNDMDATQFRLTVGDSARRMQIWPTRVKFTITEYIED